MGEREQDRRDQRERETYTHTDRQLDRQRLRNREMKGQGINFITQRFSKYILC